MSLLSWERGLKLLILLHLLCHSVAPLVGAWIEILLPDVTTEGYASLLSWERGLKFKRILMM